MNALEQYINKIHSVEPYEEEWTKKFDKRFVQVRLTTNCYGREVTEDHVFETKLWEKVKKQGYYMG